ncbi:hypothetical protein CHS0354_038638 [Potamilus streckersoni]|uniref:Uncharacterized protein n=1 Tax=Potamilus streckersoni TaxID=2493646 RepID=A0AAE0T7Q1_9BIVA|nr:hypothetical protein CHS0354_038638 [Potamilus streckersoni]
MPSVTFNLNFSARSSIASSVNDATFIINSPSSTAVDFSVTYVINADASAAYLINDAFNPDGTAATRESHPSLPQMTPPLQLTPPALMIPSTLHEMALQPPPQTSKRNSLKPCEEIKNLFMCIKQL